MLEKYDKAIAYVNENEKAIINDLTTKAQIFLEDNFGLDLEIPIKLNGRLKRSMGRFRFYRNKGSFDIEISKVLVIQSILEGHERSLDGVLYHELIHYALFEQGLPNGDFDLPFINACNSLNVPLTGTVRIKKKVHVYSCDGGHSNISNNRFNENDYICAKCKGALTYKGQDYR